MNTDSPNLLDLILDAPHPSELNHLSIEWIHHHIAKALTSEQQAEVDQHLTTCSQCQAAVANELQAIANMSRRTDLKAQLWSNIQTAIAEERVVPAPSHALSPIQLGQSALAILQRSVGIIGQSAANAQADLSSLSGDVRQALGQLAAALLSDFGSPVAQGARNSSPSSTPTDPESQLAQLAQDITDAFTHTGRVDRTRGTFALRREPGLPPVLLARPTRTDDWMPFELIATDATGRTTTLCSQGSELLLVSLARLPTPLVSVGLRFL